MKSFRKLCMMTASLSMAYIPFSCSNAYAATNPAAKVRAEVNGKMYPAIAVGDTTYVEWGALDAFHTPYQYLGDGTFAITGGKLQGVVYNGNTYLPWYSLASKVKATPLKGGGFNFTSAWVSHNYRIVIDTQQVGTVGSPDGFSVFVTDGDQTVPNQTIQISFPGTSYASDFNGDTSITVTTDQDGNWFGAVNDVTNESVQPVVTWKDPNGNIETKTASITFTNPVSAQTSIPADDSVVATVPITTFENAILFNAQGAGQDILFQLDTGAYEPLITKQVATLLQLPNLGDTEVRGVAGEDPAYYSEMTVTIGGYLFQKIPCIVDDNYSGPPLFGYGFFKDNGYDLLVSQKHNSISILQ